MVDTVGDTVGLLDVEVKPEGLDTHEYVWPVVELPPIAVLPPGQIDVLVPAWAVGEADTVSVMYAVSFDGTESTLLLGFDVHTLIL